MLAGGLAQRLRPITETVPRALMEVSGQSFSEHQVGRGNISDVVLGAFNEAPVAVMVMGEPENAVK